MWVWGFFYLVAKGEWWPRKACSCVLENSWDNQMLNQWLSLCLINVYMYVAYHAQEQFYLLWIWSYLQMLSIQNTLKKCCCCKWILKKTHSKIPRELWVQLFVFAVSSYKKRICNLLILATLGKFFIVSSVTCVYTLLEG